MSNSKLQKRKLPETSGNSNKPLAKPVKKNNKPTKPIRKTPAVLDSFSPDTEIEELILPHPAYDEEEEEKANQRFAEVRQKNFWKDYEKGLEAIEEAKKDGENFNADEAMGYTSPEDTAEDIWKAAPEAEGREEDDLFSIDERGKYVLNREPVVKSMTNFNTWFPFDGTFIFAGIRRSGKTFAVRDVLYHMRHNFAGGIVFSATKHNGMFICLRALRSCGIAPQTPPLSICVSSYCIFCNMGRCFRLDTQWPCPLDRCP